MAHRYRCAMHERRWIAFETKKRGRIGHSSKQATKMKMGFLPHFTRGMVHEGKLASS
jgi:hypothetical protein